MICLNTEVKSLRFKANKADTLEISLLFKWVQEANIRWLSRKASSQQIQYSVFHEILERFIK